MSCAGGSVAVFPRYPRKLRALKATPAPCWIVRRGGAGRLTVVGKSGLPNSNGGGPRRLLLRIKTCGTIRIKASGPTCPRVKTELSEFR